MQCPAPLPLPGVTLGAVCCPLISGDMSLRGSSAHSVLASFVSWFHFFLLPRLPVVTSPRNHSQNSLCVRVSLEDLAGAAGELVAAPEGLLSLVVPPWLLETSHDCICH